MFDLRVWGPEENRNRWDGFETCTGTASSGMICHRRDNVPQRQIQQSLFTYFGLVCDYVPGLRLIAPAGGPAGADGRALDVPAPAGAGSFGAILLYFAGG